MLHTRRREFITLLGGAAAWPLAARAQQPAMPVVGFIAGSSPSALSQQVAAFREGLKEAGFIEGVNVAVEYRYGEGQVDRFPAFACDLVRRQVAVLVASGPAVVLAAKQASTTIPIVFSVGSDPVEIGLVASLNRPGENITGVYQFTAGLEAKRLGLLQEMVPKATAIAALVNPNYAGAKTSCAIYRWRRPGLPCSLSSCAPIRKTSSTLRSQRSFNKRPERCLSAHPHSTLLARADEVIE